MKRQLRSNMFYQFSLKLAKSSMQGTVGRQERLV